MSEARIVHVVDDDEAVRSSAELLLETLGHRVLCYASGVEFLETLDVALPGVVLLDINMPQMSGLEVQQALHGRGIPWPVIVLTGQGDIAIAVQAMKNGAVEFIEKPYETEALAHALDQAFVKFDAGTEEAARIEHAKAMIGRLTQREAQVLQGLLAGLGNKTIAYELDISPRTVEVYRAAIMDKLEARGLSSAVRLALAAGLEPLEERVGAPSNQ